MPKNMNRIKTETRTTSRRKTRVYGKKKKMNGRRIRARNFLQREESTRLEETRIFVPATSSLVPFSVAGLPLRDVRPGVSLTTRFQTPKAFTVLQTMLMRKHRARALLPKLLSTFNHVSVYYSRRNAPENVARNNHSPTNNNATQTDLRSTYQIYVTDENTKAKNKKRLKKFKNSGDIYYSRSTSPLSGRPLSLLHSLPDHAVPARHSCSYRLWRSQLTGDADGERGAVRGAFY